MQRITLSLCGLLNCIIEFMFLFVVTYGEKRFGIHNMKCSMMNSVFEPCIVLQMISPPETGNTYNRTSGAPLRSNRRSRQSRGSGRPRRSGFTSLSLQIETTRFRDWKTAVGVACWTITNIIHIIVSCKVSYRTEFRGFDEL